MNAVELATPSSFPTRQRECQTDTQLNVYSTSDDVIEYEKSENKDLEKK